MNKLDSNRRNSESVNLFQIVTTVILRSLPRGYFKGNAQSVQSTTF